MGSSFIHLIRTDSNEFFLMAEWYSIVHMYHWFLIHSSADGHLGCFHVLAIINSAAMNIGVHVSLSDLVSSVCMPRSGIAGSYGSSISSFFLKFTITKTLGPLRITQNLLFLCFITTKPRWQCISLQGGLLNIFIPVLRTSAQKKKKKVP